MAMGFGASGMAGGIGQGLMQSANMINQHTLLDKQMANQQQMQQNNPYVRLAAMRGMGASGLASPTMGTTGEGGQGFRAANSAVNASTYGKPGLAGGASDPEGRFNPATMPMDELLGDPGIGLNQRSEGMQAWQQQTVPIANAYIQAKSSYDEALQKKQAADEEINTARQLAQRQLKELAASYQAAQGDYEGQRAIQQQIEKVRLALQTRERQQVDLQKQIAGLEEAMSEYGQQLASVLPGLSIPEGQRSLHAKGETPAMGPQLAGPRDLAQRIYPPGQIPPSMSASGYFPVNPKNSR